MKAETMASENIKRAQTDPSQVRKVKKEKRRATTIGWTPEVRQESLSPSARRKLSIDNPHRVLFPKTSRSSESYSGVFSCRTVRPLALTTTIQNLTFSLINPPFSNKLHLKLHLLPITLSNLFYINLKTILFNLTKIYNTYK